jgi:hypothetical protein
MLLAGAFAGFLFLGLIVSDWLYFLRLTPDAVRYGCTIARLQDHLSQLERSALVHRFDGNGALVLPHGIARFFPETNLIGLRPHYRLFARGFRTAWPIKGAIHVTTEPGRVNLLCIKRIPWSSALLTLGWFLLVTGGTLAFLASYIAQGGLASLSGVVMGLGITALGVMVIAFGALVVILAYRLENGRLTLVYHELRQALDGAATPRTT